jgi:hypothetical protein
MKKALLCCGPWSEAFGDFDEIWSLGPLVERRLLSQGFRSRNLFDVELPDLDQSLRLRVESGLEAEAARGGVSAWADIAVQHVHWRFVRYYQYRLRLERLVSETRVTNLVVSSRDDRDLIQACEAICNQLHIGLEWQDNSCDPPSSLLSFLASYDLPQDVTALENCASRLLALYYRYKKINVFYQPYNNLRASYPAAAVLTWRRSIFFPGSGLPELAYGRSRSLVNLHTPINEHHEVSFNPESWRGFDSYDLVVLSSAFSYFRRRYSKLTIDHIFACVQKFFKWTRVNRVVLNSDNTCTTRLLAKAAKSQGIYVDYMPHGLIQEDMSLQTRTNCGADRILAWNAASAAAFAHRGNCAKVISHPSNAGCVARKRALPVNLSTMRVLIMLPEWVVLSFTGRPDCFERDLLDVMASLRRLDVRSVQVKCHDSNKTVLDAKLAMLEAIRQYAPIDFKVIDSKVDAQQLYEQFDLAIIGPTTGLLEASRSSTPFVGFRAMMRKAALFNGFNLPYADTVEELLQCIQSYDVNAVDTQCQRLSESLRTGVHPFSVALDDDPPA